MKLSVVIPTRDRAALLRKCLKSVLDQDLARDEYEVIVVGDGPDPAAARVIPQGVTYTELPFNSGQSAARNAGVRISSAPRLLFLDDDMTASRGLLAIHADGEDVVFGKTVEPAGPGEYYTRLDRDPLPRWPLDACLGTNCSVDRASFDVAGGYDEAVFPRHGEDVDLGLRLWKQGVPFRYRADAVAAHGDAKRGIARLRDLEAHAAAEVALAARYPEFRSHLPLARSRWKRAILRAGTWLPYWGGRQEFAWMAGIVRGAGPRLSVLLYHHVGTPSEEPARHSLTVSTDDFERQLRWLVRSGYSPIAPSQWAAWIQNGQPLPPKPVLLTFDDGYAELGEFAFPLMERLGAKGAIFPISRLSRWEGRDLMRAAELLIWERAGIETGGHSRTHPDLRNADDEEITGCMDDLRRRGLSPTAFAYPFGEYDARVQESVQAVSPMAFTCDEGLNDRLADRWRMKRTMVQPNDTMVDFWFRVRLGWSPLNRVATWLRPRSRVRGLCRRLGFQV